MSVFFGVLLGLFFSSLATGMAIHALRVSKSSNHRRCAGRFAEIEAELGELHTRNERLLKALRKAQARHATDSRQKSPANGELADPNTHPDDWKRQMRLKLAAQKEH